MGNDETSVNHEEEEAKPPRGRCTCCGTKRNAKAECLHKSKQLQNHAIGGHVRQVCAFVVSSR